MGDKAGKVVGGQVQARSCRPSVGFGFFLKAIGNQKHFSVYVSHDKI